MYTTDKIYQKQQQAIAQQRIMNIARRYASRTRRIKELEWQWRTYQAFGDWQTAIDVLEEQMVVWGRKEQMENRELVKQFDTMLKEQIVPDAKSEWNEQDYDLLGKARACSEARYALRFMHVEQAVDYLEQRRQSILEGLDDLSCSEADAYKKRAAAAGLAIIVSQLKRKIEHRLTSSVTACKL